MCIIAGMVNDISTKGHYKGLCNLSRCTTGEPATWYNRGSYAYYCQSCAQMLNADPYNVRDAMRLFGGPLCRQRAGVDARDGKPLWVGDLIETVQDTKFEVVSILGVPALKDLSGAFFELKEWMAPNIWLIGEAEIPTIL